MSFNRIRYLSLLVALCFIGCKTPEVELPHEANLMHEGGGPIAVSPPEWDKQSTRNQDVYSQIRASKEIHAQTHLHLVTADNAPNHDGHLDLVVKMGSTVQGGPLTGIPDWSKPSLTIRIPLSSTDDAYGESRSCTLSRNGMPYFVYTAGLDEQNFVPFAPMYGDRSFDFPLNKYICRALAAPYPCQGSKHEKPAVQSPTMDMSRMKIFIGYVEISSSNTPARADVSDITLTSSGKPFDYATCAKVAPSDGMCCVAHKQTEWHCGTKPEGAGWHQVSGSCYHRETGAACSD